MASSYETTCPACGGKAHWNTDDGITYCDEPKCIDRRTGKPSESRMHVEYPNYSPPDRRGG